MNCTCNVAVEQNGVHRHTFARNYDRRVVISRQSISAIIIVGEGLHEARERGHFNNPYTVPTKNGDVAIAQCTATNDTHDGVGKLFFVFAFP